MANTLRFKRGLVSGIPTAALGEPLFTTDTFDLYIGNGTGNTRFQKYIASGATTQILRGDGSLYTFPLSISSPTNGQVLKYNGTSWVNDSDSGITGSGLAGQVAYFTGATTQGGNNNLFWDSTNNRLGIGTNVPTQALHVIGNAMVNRDNNFIFDNLDNGNNGALVWRNADGTRTMSAQITSVSDGTFARKGIGFFTKDVADWTTPATQKMLLNASGNLGLGVTPNTWTSNIKVFQVGERTALWDTQGATLLSYNSYNDGTNRYRISSVLAMRFFMQDGGHYWQTAPSGTAGNPITYSTPMTLTANGRLLLGTTSEGTQLLQVNGTSYFADNMVVGGTSVYGATITSYGSATRSGGIGIRNSAGTAAGGFYTYAAGSGSGSTDIYAEATGFMAFATGGSERVRITSGGSVGIGTTSPTYKTHIKGGNASTLKLDNDGSQYVQLMFERNTVANSGGDILLDGTNGTFSIRALAANDFTITTGATAGGVTERLRIKNTGNLLIGSTTDSGEKLQVTGTMKVTGASTFGSSIVATSSITANNGIYASASGVGYISLLQGTAGGSGYVNFYSAGGVRQAYIGFSTTTATTDAGTLPYVAGTHAFTGAATFSSSVTAASFIPSGSSVPTNGMYLSAANTLNFATNSGNRLSISSTGLVTFTDSAVFANLKGCRFTQTGGSLFGSISMDSSNAITIDNNGFFGLSIASNYTMTGGNLGIGHGQFGTSATKTISVNNGTAPSSSPTDTFQMYSNDVTAGNAAPHFRTENGAVIKLYQETTAVGNSTISIGGGSAVLDDTEFDGYTLRQIVKALRNQGILA